MNELLIYNGLGRLAEEKGERLILENALELLCAAHRHCGTKQPIVQVDVLVNIQTQPGSSHGSRKTIFVAGETSLQRIFNSIKLSHWLRTGKLEKKVSKFFYQIGYNNYQIVVYPFAS